MTEIHGAGGRPLTPDEKKVYQKEYRDGAKLFEKTLSRYETSDDKYQKHEFLQVMQKANQVLNDAARALKDKDLQEKNEKISKDFAAFQKHPDEKHASLLKQDLEDLLE